MDRTPTLDEAAAILAVGWVREAVVDGRMLAGTLDQVVCQLDVRPHELRRPVGPRPGAALALETV